MLGWLFLLGSIYLTATKSAWWAIGVVVLSMWKYAIWQKYKSRPWRVVHFPAMRLYARAVGAASARAENEGRPTEIKQALELFLGYQGVSKSRLSDVIETEEARRLSFGDEGALRKHVRKLNPEAKDDELDDVMNGLRSSFTKDERLLVPLVIGSIIEAQYSEEDRAEYLFEYLQGNAT